MKELIINIISPGKDIEIKRFRLIHSRRYRNGFIKNMSSNKHSYNQESYFNHLINYFMEKSEIQFTLFSLNVIALFFLAFGAIVTMSFATTKGVLLSIQFAISAIMLYRFSNYILEGYYLTYFTIGYYRSMKKVFCTQDPE